MNDKPKQPPLNDHQKALLNKGAYLDLAHSMRRREAENDKPTEPTTPDIQAAHDGVSTGEIQEYFDLKGGGLEPLMSSYAYILLRRLAEEHDAYHLEAAKRINLDGQVERLQARLDEVGKLPIYSMGYDEIAGEVISITLVGKTEKIWGKRFIDVAELQAALKANG